MKKNQKKDESEIDIDEELDYDGGNVVDDVSVFKLTEQTHKSEKKKSGLKKRLLITLIVVAVLAVLTVIVYFAVIKPIYDEKKEKENTEEPEPLIDGEVRDSGGSKILLYEYTNKASTNRITVENPNGGFNLVRDEEGGFYVKEHSKYKPVSETTVNNLVSAAGNPVIARRISEKCDNLSLYGLDESDSPIKVTIENTDGKTNSFYIGNLIVSEGGYYCKAEGRSAVYILSLSDVSALLASSESLIEPILGPVFASDNSAQEMTSFLMNKNGQLFLEIDYVAPTSETYRPSSYNMKYPAGYVVNDTNYGTGVLTKIANAEGYTVVKAGDGTDSLYKKPEVMAEFGFVDIDNPLYEVVYTYGSGEDRLWGRIIFAESGSDAYYYAYSYYWDTIVLIEKSEVDFLEWDLLEYINGKILNNSIANVSKLSVTGSFKYYDNKEYKEYNVDETFNYDYDEDGTLHCEAESTGMKYTGSGIEFNHVQAFYHSALYLSIEGYISEKDVSFKPDEVKLYATFTIEFKDGEKQVYKFYSVTDAICYFTVNDDTGDFYVNTQQVNRLMINAVRASNGCTIDSSKDHPSPPDSFKNRVDGKAWEIKNENA